MTETIDVAITALQNISNQWYTVGAKYNNLLQNVKGITPEEFTFIKEDLHTAKDSWKDVKDYTEKLHEGVAEVNSGLVLLFIFYPVFVRGGLVI